jgi:hypothetical protein
MANEQASNGTGTYLYAVASGLSEADLGPIGLFDTRVYPVTITNGGGELVAVVSDIPTADELRPERKNLAAHQRVLQKVIESSRVALPVSFGTVADSADGIRNLLTRYQADLKEQMHRVEGKVEIAARTYYKPEKPSVFEFFVSRNPELAQLRDRLTGSGRQPTRDEKIELGQAFEQALNRAREEYASALERELQPYCAEVKRNAPVNEQELVRLACLIPKDKQRDFQAALDRSAKALPDELLIEEHGPFPPYDFVELHLTV